MKDGCCKTKFQYVKVKDTHVAADTINTPAKSFTDLNFTIPSFQIIRSITEQLAVDQYGHAPPVYHPVALYIFDCVYRI